MNIPIPTDLATHLVTPHRFVESRILDIRFNSHPSVNGLEACYEEREHGIDARGMPFTSMRPVWRKIETVNKAPEA